ncbi:MAG: HesA/MoeB/ThiF family protein [Oscillospiraceae bacterium]|nr:HesA/MoeB/ThiF family protein [Oscillospiraceae bacterium]
MTDKSFELNTGPVPEQERQKLSQSRVFIAGCGGIGGYLLEYMTRAKVGHIIIADNDSFEESNLNRQILADSGNIGQKKVVCAVERALRICPQTDIQGLDVYLDSDNLCRLIGGADLVMDALDNIPSRKALCEACFKAGITLAHGAASGWLAQAAIVSPESRLYDVLYSDKNGQKPAGGVLPFTVAAAASMQSALALGYLCGGCAENNLHIFDLHTMKMETIQF